MIPSTVITSASFQREIVTTITVRNTALVYIKVDGGITIATLRISMDFILKEFTVHMRMESTGMAGEVSSIP